MPWLIGAAVFGGLDVIKTIAGFFGHASGNDHKGSMWAPALLGAAAMWFILTRGRVR